MRHVTTRRKQSVLALGLAGLAVGAAIASGGAASADHAGLLPATVNVPLGGGAPAPPPPPPPPPVDDPGAPAPADAPADAQSGAPGQPTP